jgi:hypothetical protein
MAKAVWKCCVLTKKLVQSEKRQVTAKQNQEAPIGFSHRFCPEYRDELSTDMCGSQKRFKALCHITSILLMHSPKEPGSIAV